MIQIGVTLLAVMWANLARNIARRCVPIAVHNRTAAKTRDFMSDYGPQILGYLTSILRNDADAAEVFSQFTEDLWRGLPGFRGECPVRVWAYRLAWHAAARRLGFVGRGVTKVKVVVE